MAGNTVTFRTSHVLLLGGALVVGAVVAVLLATSFSHKPQPVLVTVKQPSSPLMGLADRSAEAAALSAVRNAVVAAEEYYAVNGSYAGMTTGELKQIDHSLTDARVGWVRSGDTYCLEAAAQTSHGPESYRTIRGSGAEDGGTVVRGSC